MKHARRKKRGRKRLRAMREVWHRGIKPELDRLGRKVDRLVAESKRQRTARIGFRFPSPGCEDAE